MQEHEKQWMKDYFNRYQKDLVDQELWSRLLGLKELFKITNAKGSMIYIAGNGGSAAIASHVSVDLTKNAKIRCMAFNDASFITCLANDYGYENWLSAAIEFYGRPGDVGVFISSGGKSPNIVKAAQKAREKEMKTVTFTGFSEANPLRQLGDMNFWVDSCAYNVVENIHQIWLLAVVDMIIGKAEYAAS